MAITHAFVGMAVADLDAGLAWYGRFMGRPPDLVPNKTDPEGNTITLGQSLGT